MNDIDTIIIHQAAFRQVRDERDEARARHAKAVALLRFARNGLAKVLDGTCHDQGWTCQAEHFIGKIDAHLAACDGSGS